MKAIKRTISTYGVQGGGFLGLIWSRGDDGVPLRRGKTWLGDFLVGGFTNFITGSVEQKVINSNKHLTLAHRRPSLPQSF